LEGEAELVLGGPVPRHAGGDPGGLRTSHALARNAAGAAALDRLERAAAAEQQQTKRRRLAAAAVARSR
jgi:hypothetical protein